MGHEVFTRKERAAAAKKATRLLKKYDDLSVKARKKRQELDDLIDERDAIDKAIKALADGYTLKFRELEQGRAYVTSEVAKELDRIEEKGT